MNWLRRMFHLHRWEIHERVALTIRNEKGEVTARGDRYVLRCSICGEMMYRDIT